MAVGSSPLARLEISVHRAVRSTGISLEVLLAQAYRTGQENLGVVRYQLTPSGDIGPTHDAPCLMIIVFPSMCTAGYNTIMLISAFRHVLPCPEDSPAVTIICHPH